MMPPLSRRRALVLCASAAGLDLAAPALSAGPQSAIDLSKIALRVGDQTGATQSKLRAAGLLDNVPYRIEWSVYAAAANLHEALKAGAIDIRARR